MQTMLLLKFKKNGWMKFRINKSVCMEEKKLDTNNDSYQL